MQITLKTLQHETIVMDIDGEQTVKVLKEKLEAEKGSGNFPVARQKLIYAGKVLEDDAQIKEYKIDEKNFVVVMVTKPPRSVPPPPPPAPLPSSSSSRRRPPPPVPAPAAIPFTPLQLDVVEEYDVSSATETDEMVGRIVSMGYEREKALAALRASHNDPDLAVEYLINGFPTVPVQETSPVTTHTPSTDLLSTEGGNPLEFLNSNPLFQRMRPQVQQDPSLLQSLLQELTRESSEMLQQITQNQARFLDMLNAQVGEGEREQHGSPGATGGEETTDDCVQVTAQEKEAIERLKELGFPEAQVRQAYFDCQKNENLAANLLLAQASSEDD